MWRLALLLDESLMPTGVKLFFGVTDTRAGKEVYGTAVTQWDGKCVVEARMVQLNDFT